MKTDTQLDRNALALRLAIDWMATERRRIDTTQSGDIMQTREVTTEVAGYFLAWIEGRM